MTINFEIYVSTEGGVLCMPDQKDAGEASVVYVDNYQMVVTPRDAVRRVELTTDRMLKKFVYDHRKVIKKARLNECDENVRLSVNNFREAMISESIRREIERN